MMTTYPYVTVGFTLTSASGSAEIHVELRGWPCWCGLRSTVLQSKGPQCTLTIITQSMMPSGECSVRKMHCLHHPSFSPDSVQSSSPCMHHRRCMRICPFTATDDVTAASHQRWRAAATHRAYPPPPPGGLFMDVALQKRCALKTLLLHQVAQ